MIQNYRGDIAEAVKDIRDPGTYGPPTMELIDDDVTINTADVTLQNTLITGNLYLSASIQEGTITLDKVEVQGEVIIAGGEFTLLMVDSSLPSVTLQQSEGAMTLTAQGATNVGYVEVGTEATLQEDGIDEGAHGFRDVQVSTDKKVLLLGDFNRLDIIAMDADVKLVKGSVATVNLKSTAASAQLELSKDVAVEKMSLEAEMTLTGEGAVDTLTVEAPGLVKVKGSLGEVTLQVAGIFLELKAGSIEKLLVPKLDSASSIDLAADTVVKSMELNGRTGVTGTGKIKFVAINHSGVEIRQSPEAIEIAEDLVALIHGEEYRAEAEEEPEPEPSTPTVSLNTFSNVNINDFGQTRTVNVSATSGANVTVSSSNNNIASVSLSGNTITVTGNRQGTATITVRATRSGYNPRTRTFTVNVDPIKNIDRKNMDQLTSTVAVILHNNDPNKYKVELQGHGELTFDSMGGQQMFWDIVDAGVRNNKIIVTRR